MAEPNFRVVATGSETELLELLRLAHLEDYVCTVEHLAGTFRVCVTDLLQNRYLEGSGLSFEEAWRTLRSVADDQPLALQDRIAAGCWPSADSG